MNKKYVKRITDAFPQGNIFDDYEYYLAVEGLYTVLFFGKHQPNDIRKANYIWKALLKSYDYI